MSDDSNPDAAQRAVLARMMATRMLGGDDPRVQRHVLAGGPIHDDHGDRGKPIPYPDLIARMARSDPVSPSPDHPAQSEGDACSQIDDDNYAALLVAAYAQSDPVIQRGMEVLAQARAQPYQAPHLETRDPAPPAEPTHSMEADMQGYYNIVTRHFEEARRLEHEASKTPLVVFPAMRKMMIEHHPFCSMDIIREGDLVEASIPLPSQLKPSAPVIPRSCWACGKEETRLQCSRCKTGRYCDETCLARDWPIHKQYCHTDGFHWPGPPRII